MLLQYALINILNFKNTHAKLSNRKKQLLLSKKPELITFFPCGVLHHLPEKWSAYRQREQCLVIHIKTQKLENFPLSFVHCHSSLLKIP